MIELIQDLPALQDQHQRQTMNADQDELRHTNLPNRTLVDHIAPAGLALAIGAGLSAVISGLGTRWGWADSTTGFIILRWSAVAGLVATFVCLTGGILAGWKIRKHRGHHCPDRTSGGGRCCRHTLVMDADRTNRCHGSMTSRLIWRIRRVLFRSCCSGRTRQIRRNTAAAG